MSSTTTDYNTINVQLGNNPLSIHDVVGVARGMHKIASLDSKVINRVEATAQWVANTVENIEVKKHVGEKASPYYGINTGVGALAGKTALDSKYLTKALSRNLIASHAVAVGAYFDEEIVRASMLIRAQALTQGSSGVRPLIIEKLIDMLNNRVYPAIPEKGSLGASGDLAPLSHLILALCHIPIPNSPEDDLHLDPTDGEIFVPLASSETNREKTSIYYHITENYPNSEQTIWQRVSGAIGMASVGGQVELQAKEALALINGTMFSTAIAALTMHDAKNLLDNAELVAALTLEGIRGFRDSLYSQIHQARGHVNAEKTAEQVQRYIEGSQLLDCGNLETNPGRIPPQDPYSIRCVPQVLGTIRDTLEYSSKWVEMDINAVTGNPLIFLDIPRDYKTVSGCNFHGEPIAMAMDFLGIAITELGNISERRIFKLTDYHPEQTYEDPINKINPKHGLTRFLIDDSMPETEGINSGFMILQYTAASLVSDCKTLAHPDCIDSIPSSANQEDHVSMSLNAARHAREIVKNIEYVIAMEFLCATQAISLQLNKTGNHALKMGKGTNAAYHCIREAGIEKLKMDRVLYPDMKKAVRLVRSGELVKAARQATGQKN